MTPEINSNENQITQPVSAVPTENMAVDKRRHFLAVFFFSFLFGVFGVDRFYLGKFWTGLLKLITFGGLGFWAMIDLSLVMSGSMRDKQGNEMIDYQRYKKFARKTVWIFSSVVLLTVLIIGAISIYFAIQFMQNGGLNKFLPSLIPGYSNIQGATGGGQQTVNMQDIQKILSGLNAK